MDKRAIRREFAKSPGRYYEVELFAERGYARRGCSVCGRFFWTASDREACPDHSSETYSFIGDSPASRPLDYAESWEVIKNYFEKNGHTSIPRYPVVCRWRDDLYFTIASIVDFQRVYGGSVSFEFPANPLVVPQTCLRFKDIENVGVTGRHFSSFCMIGQHCTGDVYWKDRCVDLDFGLLSEFGIPKSEIDFVEDVWEGGGSFGPSLEYFVRGLEIGNAVFTEFQGEIGSHTELDTRIIDMGAGLERFAWISSGTPTAYDCCFGRGAISYVFDAFGVDADSGGLRSYYMHVARLLDRHSLSEVRRKAADMAGLSGDEARAIQRLEAAYMVLDHTRTLLFGIVDGALPSNVGGGYNLRMMLRRVADALSRYGVKMDVAELLERHASYLRGTYPELYEHNSSTGQIIRLELERYVESKARMAGKMSKMRLGRSPSVDRLVTLYESDGISAEVLQDAGIIDVIPDEYHTRLAELRQDRKKSTVAPVLFDNIPDTVLLFYGEDPAEFEAEVLAYSDGWAVLDRTAFYARGGGQEPDLGRIGGHTVLDVQKHGGLILHRVDGELPLGMVQCSVDRTRRMRITKNHTGTHILNAAARNILGPWVWQHSAFKDVDHARLDVTHHSSLGLEQAQQIEQEANRIISMDVPVSIQYFDRGEAEQRYGFRIYQGGVVPVKRVRIVSIGDIDVEACGGTHVKRTGEVERLVVTRTKRIQDGVVRLEFMTGEAAAEYVRPRSVARSTRDRTQDRTESRDIISEILPHIRERGEMHGVQYSGGRCVGVGRDEYFHAQMGKKVSNLGFAYCGVFESDGSVRVVAYCDKDSGVDALDVVKRLSEICGGRGGGNAIFARGGGKDTHKMGAVADMAVEILL